jgi:signal transduction histidine kinase
MKVAALSNRTMLHSPMVILSGIPADNLARVFDPFFTTKFGSSSGLGLTIVYNLVTYIVDGKIYVESTEQCSHFIITLPRIAPQHDETCSSLKI